MVDEKYPWYRKVSIDWDGVVEVFPHVDPVEMIPGAMVGIKAFLDAGWKVYIFSAGNKDKSRRNTIIKRLQEWSKGVCPGGFLTAYPDQIEFPSQKPGAKLYVDDRSFKFEGWDSLGVEIAEGFRAWWQHPSSTR